MEQNELLQQKLGALIETGKKEGKITSKQLLQTLDAIDADDRQTEQIYDALEKAGIEIDVSDVAEILDAADELLPTDADLMELDERIPEDVDDTDAFVEETATTDPVRKPIEIPGLVLLLFDKPDPHVRQTHRKTVIKADTAFFNRDTHARHARHVFGNGDCPGMNLAD